MDPGDDGGHCSAPPVPTLREAAPGQGPRAERVVDLWRRHGHRCGVDARQVLPRDRSNHARAGQAHVLDPSRCLEFEQRQAQLLVLVARTSSSALTWSSSTRFCTIRVWRRTMPSSEPNTTQTQAQRTRGRPSERGAPCSETDRCDSEGRGSLRSCVHPSASGESAESGAARPRVRRTSSTPGCGRHARAIRIRTVGACREIVGLDGESHRVLDDSVLAGVVGEHKADPPGRGGR